MDAQDHCEASPIIRYCEKEIPMALKDVKPFLNKTGGFIIFPPVSKKKLKK